MGLGLELVGSIREVGDADIAPEAQTPTLRRLRSSHHMAARLLAEGKRPTDVALMVGYSLSRVSILQRDPAFNELVSHYAARHTEVLEDFSQTAEALARDAFQEVHDRVLDDPEAINTVTMLEIGRTAAAHAGLGPVTRSLNVNVQRNWGDQLDAAKARRAAFAGSILEPAKKQDYSVLEPAKPLGYSVGEAYTRPSDPSGPSPEGGLDE